MDKVKLVEDSLQKILLGLFLNTLTQIEYTESTIRSVSVIKNVLPSKISRWKLPKAFITRKIVSPLEAYSSDPSTSAFF